jgi:GWxTD domain-containing protein
MVPILRPTLGKRKTTVKCLAKARRTGVLAFVVMAVATSGPPPLCAQAPAPEPSAFLATAAQLTSRGDTAEAIRTLAQAVRLFPGFAEAHYLRGLLLSRTAGAALGDHLHRLAAQHELEQALNIDHNNPLYLLELGRLRLKMPFLRIEASRFFHRAERAARERGDSAIIAEVEAELGDLYARRAGNAAHRRVLTGGALHFDPDRALADWRYASNFIAEQSTAVDDPGTLDRHQAEDHYRAALAANIGHEGAARGLLGMLYDERRHEEYLTVARSLARARPGSGRAQLALGLGLLAALREVEASVAFDSALALMTPSEHHAVEDLSPILRRADAERYQSLSPDDRREAERIYWALSDPLRLTPVNEHRLEHFARVAYADLRYTAPELGLRGWETDRGVIYIRYGPPPVIATFPANPAASTEQVGMITTVWWYPERKLRFVFYGAPGYNVARFASDFQAYAEDARYAAPARYDNVLVDDALDSIAVQVARFRDPVGANTLVFYAGMPVARMLNGIDLRRSTLETGIFVTDRLERSIFERRSQEPVTLSEERQFEARTFEVRLAPGEYHYRLEAREPSSRRAARGAASLAVPARAGAGLDLSDVVLADRVAPRGDDPRGRRDFFIEPNPAMAYAPGHPVHLYWEVYGLRPDSTGAGSYAVSVVIRLQALERHGLAARLVGGALDAMGVTAAGDNQVVLSYGREVSLRGLDRVPEFLAVDLGDSPPGLYTLEISVEDRHAGQTVVRTRTFTVSRSAGR